MATESLIPAVFGAANEAISSLLIIAITSPSSSFRGHKPDDLALANGRVFRQGEGPEKGLPFGDLLRRANVRLVNGSGKGEQSFFVPGAKFSKHSLGYHFVEVTWQPEIARLRVSRVVTVMDAGRILNPLAGSNQIQGAVVMGIGMALFEETFYELQNGAPINSNLADYMVTANADAPPIDVTFLDYPDMKINELGARGIGEIGLAGVAAAIASSVHHTTGVRVRDLPVEIEDLLV
jgi:xanthine dehydrogenase YagR molybdenum-binding subunit